MGKKEKVPKGYKMTVVGIIPEEWDSAKLEELSKSFVGIASSATHAYSPHGVLLVRNQNIKEGYIDLNDILYVTPEYEKQHAKKRLKEHDILTVRTGYPGVSAVVPASLAGCQSFTTLITRIQSPAVLADFLCAYINSDSGKSFFADRQAGGAQKNVGSQTLQKMCIPLPPLPEQRKIAEILTSVDETIESTRKVIAQTKTVKQGLLQELLTKGIGHRKFKDTEIGRIPAEWEVVRLGDVFQGIVDCPHSTPVYADEGYPVIRTMNIRDGHIVETDLKFVDKDNYDIRVARAVPVEGDVIFTREAPAGEALVVSKSMQPCLGQRTVLLQSGGDVTLAQYFCFGVYTETIRKRIHLLSDGSTVSHMNMKDIRQFKFPFPTREEMNQIVEVIRKVEYELTANLACLNKLILTKKGLMSDLLTGKKRVKL